MPLIFQINANNSAISARIDYGDHYGDNGEYGVQRIKKRFQMFGSLFMEGFITHADDVAGGVQSMRDAVDQVLETGKPTYCVSRFRSARVDMRRTRALRLTRCCWTSTSNTRIRW
jgi:hypothetical protein